jgi:hypothetical protein
MRLLALVFLVLAPAAHAGSLPGDPMVQQLINGETDPVDLGSKSAFNLFESTLSAEAMMYGVPVRNQGFGDYSFACATDGEWAVWMLSDRTNIDNEPMLTAVIETRAPKDELGCDQVADLRMRSSREGQPGIAVKVDEFRDLVDLDEVTNGLVAFQGQVRLGDGGHSWLVVSTLTYHIADDGSIDGVAYEVGTID